MVEGIWNLEVEFEEEEEEGNDELYNLFCEVGRDRVYYRLAYWLCYWHLHIMRGVNQRPECVPKKDWDMMSAVGRNAINSDDDQRYVSDDWWERTDSINNRTIAS